MSKIEKTVLFTIYFGINSLFIYKYGLRQNYIPVLLLLLAFPALILTIYYSIFKSKLKPSQIKIIYITIASIFFIFTIFLNFIVDVNSLNVDRWSAMEISITSIFKNIYPYSAVDHLGGKSSNLPGLIVIGIPFYLMGNIGLLQSFSFLLFAYTIYKTINNAKAKLFGLLLLVLSVSFWWEIYVKSDLISNFIILVSFVILWYYKYKNETITKPWLLGSLSSLLFFTRLVAIIPLTLLLFKTFLKSNYKKKLIFITSSIITIILLSLLVLKDCPNYEVFKENNPFSLQNRQLPFVLSLIFIIVPFYYSHKVTSLSNLIKFSVIFLFIPVITSFIISLINYGLNDIIYNSAFDLSYFNIVMPFLIFYIIVKFDEKQFKT